MYNVILKSEFTFTAFRVNMIMINDMEINTDEWNASVNLQVSAAMKIEKEVIKTNMFIHRKLALSRYSVDFWSLVYYFLVQEISSCTLRRRRPLTGGSCSPCCGASWWWKWWSGGRICSWECCGGAGYQQALQFWTGEKQAHCWGLRFISSIQNWMLTKEGRKEAAWFDTYTWKR